MRVVLNVLCKEGPLGKQRYFGDRYFEPKP